VPEYLPMAEKKTRLFYHLKKWLEIAALDYGMFQEDDRVLVGVSGGSDSLVLLDLLSTPMVHLSPFTIVAANVDLGFDPSYGDYRILEACLKDRGLEYVMEKTDIGVYAHGPENRKNPCFLCSRLRRKRLFEIAKDRGCNKIALAHHRDDIIETLLLNLFFAREISGMVPDLSFFGGEFHIVRPLAYIREVLVKKYAREQNFPVIENRCPSSATSKRIFIKRLLDDLEKENKDVRNNIFLALQHVKPEYLLGKKIGEGLEVLKVRKRELKKRNHPGKN